MTNEELASWCESAASNLPELGEGALSNLRLIAQRLRADVCGSDNGFLKAGYNWVQYGYELYDKGNGHIGVKRIGFDPEPQNVSDNSALPSTND